jgi:hypothetical protein
MLAYGEYEMDTRGREEEGSMFFHYIVFCNVELKIKKGWGGQWLTQEVEIGGTWLSPASAKS